MLTLKRSLLAVIMISILFIQTDAKNIVIGVEFLFSPGTSASISEGKMGGGSMLFAGLRKAGARIGAANSPEEQFFALLKSINPKQSTENTIVWHGNNGPHLIYENLVTARAWGQLLKEAQEGIDKSNLLSADKALMNSIATITFDPVKNAHVMEANSKGFKLLAKLIKAGHKIYMVDNWHPESFEYIKEKVLVELKKLLPLEKKGDDDRKLDHFISGTFISGEIKMTKSSPFFNKFFSKFKLDPNDNFIIETEPTYIEYIKSYNHKNKKNIGYTVLKDHQYDNVEKELKKAKIL